MTSSQNPTTFQEEREDKGSNKPRLWLLGGLVVLAVLVMAAQAVAGHGLPGAPPSTGGVAGQPAASSSQQPSSGPAAGPDASMQDQLDIVVRGSGGAVKQHTVLGG